MRNLTRLGSSISRWQVMDWGDSGHITDNPALAEIKYYHVSWQPKTHRYQNIRVA
jgi:hypothetical protein